MLQIVYQSLLAELIQVSPTGGNLYTKTGLAHFFTLKYECTVALNVPEGRLSRDPGE
ncbi:hypothetical protein SAMN05192562_10941 [Kosakonia arachidis]|uniref:Uncharacterized protein n=1 Tax=Kosakonia arachidis TaxID=551989 RepID=A0A1I7E327_9ENTR|nr:hypothetical protein SAMN05192562_10941 [Kosakonia arachidis]